MFLSWRLPLSLLPGIKKHWGWEHSRDLNARKGAHAGHSLRRRTNFDVKIPSSACVFGALSDRGTPPSFRDPRFTVRNRVFLHNNTELQPQGSSGTGRSRDVSQLRIRSSVQISPRCPDTNGRRSGPRRSQRGPGLKFVPPVLDVDTDPLKMRIFTRSRSEFGPLVGVSTGGQIWSVVLFAILLGSLAEVRSGPSAPSRGNHSEETCQRRVLQEFL